jgi:hypothetical protein
VSGYSKLHSSIATSSLMAMPVSARWLWAFMLSQADAHGIVEGSVPGLAIAAHVTLDECAAAIEAFLKPDQYSRTKDQEGRRLVELDGGWQIVSYAKWRHRNSAEERRDYKRRHESVRREGLRAASKQSTAVAVDRLQGRTRGQVVDK